MVAFYESVPDNMMKDIVTLEDTASKFCAIKAPRPLGFSLVFVLTHQDQKLLRVTEAGFYYGFHSKIDDQLQFGKLGSSNTMVDVRLTGDDMNVLRAENPQKSKPTNMRPKKRTEFMAAVEAFGRKWVEEGVMVSLFMTYTKKSQGEYVQSANWNEIPKTLSDIFNANCRPKSLPCVRVLMMKGSCSSCPELQKQVCLDSSLSNDQRREIVSWKHQGHIYNCIPNHAMITPDIEDKSCKRIFTKVANGPKSMFANSMENSGIVIECLRLELTPDGKVRSVLKARKIRKDKGVGKLDRPQRVEGTNQTNNLRTSAASEVLPHTLDACGEEPVLLVPFWQTFRGGMLEEGTVKVFSDDTVKNCQLLMNDVDMVTGKIKKSKFVTLDIIFGEEGDVCSCACECKMFKGIKADLASGMLVEGGSVTGPWCPHTKLVPALLEAVEYSRNDCVGEQPYFWKVLHRSRGILCIRRTDTSRTYLVVIKQEESDILTTRNIQQAKVHVELLAQKIWYGHCNCVECKSKKRKHADLDNIGILECPHLRAVLSDGLVKEDLKKSFPDKDCNEVLVVLSDDEEENEDDIENSQQPETISDEESGTEDALHKLERRERYRAVRYDNLDMTYRPGYGLGQNPIPHTINDNLRKWSRIRSTGIEYQVVTEGVFFRDNEGMLRSERVHHPDILLACPICQQSQWDIVPSGHFLLRSYLGSCRLRTGCLQCGIEGTLF